MVYRTLIVEDAPKTRVQLESAVAGSAALELAASVGSVGEATTALASQVPVDVALIDLGLPDGSGIEVIEAAHAGSSPPVVLVMTVFADEKNVLAAIEAGAMGYLLKEQPGPEIADAILAVVGGESPISPSIARHVLKRLSRTNDSVDTNSTISPRETEVLTMIVKGFTYKEIARSLGVSINTITTHIQHIYRKLSVSSRGEAAYEAIQLGIVRL